MKKVFSVIIALLMVLTVSSCNDTVTPGDSQEISEPTDSAQTLSEQIGFEMSAPATAKNVECAVINNTVGEIKFSFNSIIYEFRGSKLLSGSELHKNTYNESTRNEISIGERASVELYTDVEGGRIAQWYLNGTNFSLCCQKSVSDDALTELCDLLIP